MSKFEKAEGPIKFHKITIVKCVGITYFNKPNSPLFWCGCWWAISSWGVTCCWSSCWLCSAVMLLLWSVLWSAWEFCGPLLCDALLCDVLPCGEPIWWRLRLRRIDLVKKNRTQKMWRVSRITSDSSVSMIQIKCRNFPLWLMTIYLAV